MKTLFIFLALVISVVSCSSYLPHYTYTRQVAVQQTVRVIPVYVDKTFNHDDQVAIDNAINSWNYALNGYIKLNVVSYQFNMEPELIHKAFSEGGILMLKINSSSDFLPSDSTGSGRVLAFTNEIGGNLVYIIRDRISNENVEGVVRHEISHALGAGHNTKPSLMSVAFNRAYAQCIDKWTVEQVATFQLLNSKFMNYCIIEN